MPERLPWQQAAEILWGDLRLGVGLPLKGSMSAYTVQDTFQQICLPKGDMFL